MTTPGGVPNLPAGALTLDTLAAKTQDMSGAAMKARAVQRFPSIMDLSTGLSPALDITPFGILTRIWAEVNSLVANADPADITSPDDLPELVLEFIEGLPFVGQFVDLLAAILGTYTGNDATLKTIAQFFAPISALVGQFQQLIDTLTSGLTGTSSAGNDPLSLLFSMIGQGATVPFQVLDGLWASVAQLFAVQTAAQNNPTGVAHSDDYASVALTGRQTNVLGTMAISARGPYLQTVNFAADYLGTTGAPRKPATNKCFNAIVLDAVMDGACRAWFCGDAAMANYAAVEVYSGFGGDALRIVTGSSPTLTAEQAQIDLDAGMLASGTVIEIRYDPAANKFFVLRNMQPIGLEWEDLTNIVTHTAGKTFGGVVTNAYDRNEDGYYGPAIRKRTLDDW